MPTTSLGITYPASTGHARIWEHFQTMAEDVDDAITSAGTWTTYTPTWTATTSNPSIGNGTLTGRWRYLDPSTVAVFWVCRPGSTTTFGSGTYRFDLPVPAVSGGADPLFQGTALLGGALYRLVAWANTASGSATFVTCYRDNVTTTENLQSWTPGSPTTLANGHTVTFHGMYRVAW